MRSSVAGTGGMGARPAFHLARLRTPPSSPLTRSPRPRDGVRSSRLTRIIRLAYHEHPSYVALLRRAIRALVRARAPCWREAPHHHGFLEMGPPGSKAVEDALASCHEHDISYEMLFRGRDHGALSRLPAARGLLPACFSPTAVSSIPKAASQRHLRLAQAHGAELHTGERVLEWAPQGDGVWVRTDRGEYGGDRLVITSGAWLPKVAPRLAGWRNPSATLWPGSGRNGPSYSSRTGSPCSSSTTARRGGTTVPDAWAARLEGREASSFQGGRRSGHVRPAPQARDEATLRGFAARYFPTERARRWRLSTCLYTNTPDGHLSSTSIRGSRR